MKTRVIVSALINRGDSYLFLKQNKPGGAYPDCLHIPGGGLEEGENPEEAVRREVREEVGLDLQDVRVFDFDWDVVDYKGERVQFVFLRFTAESVDGDAVAGSDAREVLWVPRELLGTQKHNEPSLRLLRRLGLLPV